MFKTARQIRAALIETRTKNILIKTVICQLTAVGLKECITAINHHLELSIKRKGWCGLKVTNPKLLVNRKWFFSVTKRSLSCLDQNDTHQFIRRNKS